ncbi:MAG TPA: calcium-binding protein [Bauldia sp.]|nr:calcium-binding protein [Bauldia sp.]
MASSLFIGTDGKDVAYDAYDLLYGGDGDDSLSSTYNVSGDDVIIFGGAGNDYLNYVDGYSRIAYIFGDTGNDNINGGDNNDRLFGGSGNDLVTGSPGSDYVYGGSGNDRLFGYWNEADSVDDDGDYMYGDAGNDRLFGQYGDDDLHGGLGKDLLVGGDGGDEFWFDTKLNGRTNVDHIRDFGVGPDKIVIDHTIFTKVTVPVKTSDGINANEFYTGAKAHDEDDRIIYQRSTGKIFYDPDGTGSAKQVLFAVVDNKPILSTTDFWCVP